MDLGEFEPYSNYEGTLGAANLGYNDPAEVVLLGKFVGPSSQGYGHLNEYRFKLSVMKVEGVRLLATRAH